MKIIKIIFFLLMLCFVSGIMPAQAVVAPIDLYLYSFSPTPADLWDLDHHYYYTWGINWSLPSNEELVSATIRIPYINNWTNENDILYFNLLDTVAPGAHYYWDNQNGGNSFGPNSATNLFLTSYQDNDGYYGESNYGSFAYSFNSAQLNTLNSFLLDGNFGLGFDPDCHYYNKGIKFKIVTRARPVPEPTTLLLLSSGLLGFLGLRKRQI